MFGTYTEAWMAAQATAMAAAATTRTVTPIAVAPDDQAEPEPDPPLIRPPRLDHHDYTRIRSAIIAARKVLPPAVAELVERELSAWLECGFRTDMSSLMARVAAEVLTAPERLVV